MTDTVVWVCVESRAPPQEWQVARLSAPERLSVASIRNRRARVQRRLAWSLRNQLLAQRLGLSPCDLPLSRDSTGRPALIEGGDCNISHTKGAVAVGFSHGRIGVDIENQGRKVDWSRLGDKVFTPEEMEVLEALPADDRKHFGLSLWTGREAWVKALGGGLATMRDLPSFRLVEKRWLAPQGALCQVEVDGFYVSVALPDAAPTPVYEIREVSRLTSHLAADWLMSESEENSLAHRLYR